MHGHSKQIKKECWDKRQYKTEKTALHKAKLLRKQGMVGKPLRAYKCIWCGAFHLTSKEQT